MLVRDKKEYKEYFNRDKFQGETWKITFMKDISK